MNWYLGIKTFHTPRHVLRTYVIEAIRAEGETLPLRLGTVPEGKHDEFESIQRTRLAHIVLDRPVLGQLVCDITGRTVDARWYGHDQIHVAPAPPAPPDGFAAAGDGREGRLEQLVHRRYRVHKVAKLGLEDVQRMFQHVVDLRVAVRDKRALLLDRTSHRRQHQLLVDLVVPMD